MGDIDCSAQVKYKDVDVDTDGWIYIKLVSIHRIVAAVHITRYEYKPIWSRPIQSARL